MKRLDVLKKIAPMVFDEEHDLSEWTDEDYLLIPFQDDDTTSASLDALIELYMQDVREQ